MTSLDLKDAYFSLPIAKSLRKSPLSMEGPTIRISMPLVWTEPCILDSLLIGQLTL